MYIKLSISERAIAVPYCWAGMMVTLNIKPQIIEALPPDTKANQCVHRKSTGTFPEYEYYYDCGGLDRKTIEKGLELFDNRFKGKRPAKPADDSYPQNNPLVSTLELDLKRAVNSLAQSNIFKKPKDEMTSSSSVNKQNNTYKSDSDSEISLESYSDSEQENGHESLRFSLEPSSDSEQENAHESLKMQN